MFIVAWKTSILWHNTLISNSLNLLLWPHTSFAIIFFQAVSRAVAFIYVIQKNATWNMSWREWPILAAQRLQIPQKFQVRGKSYPCHRFYICRTRLGSISWIASCKKVRNSTNFRNLKTNCEATFFTHHTRSWIRHHVISFSESRQWNQLCVKTTYRT